MTKKNPRKWYLYLLRSVKDGTYYIGITPDLKKRLKVHNAGKASKYTRGRGPWGIAAFVLLDSKSEALKEEWKLKKLPREKKLGYFAYNPNGIIYS